MCRYREQSQQTNELRVPVLCFGLIGVGLTAKYKFLFFIWAHRHRANSDNFANPLDHDTWMRPRVDVGSQAVNSVTSPCCSLAQTYKSVSLSTSPCCSSRLDISYCSDPVERWGNMLHSVNKHPCLT
jgi:hypothetical protein